mgnify:CR=1 FL=1|tara:strand:+ start:17189 stop:17542 length:354 start_codon:yes stop_codon:yes gene_type:complete
MACNANPFMKNPMPVEEKRWSKLQALNPSQNNELDVTTCHRFKTVDMGERAGERAGERNGERNGERTNTFTSSNNGKQEITYSSFAAFTKTPEKPKKIFDMKQMTDDMLNNEFPSLC